MSHVDGVDDGVGYGVQGRSQRQGYGVVGNSDGDIGVWGKSDKGTGVVGTSKSSSGVDGTSESSAGVSGQSGTYHGVHGESNGDDGVYGYTSRPPGTGASAGVVGEGKGNMLGVWGKSEGSTLGSVRGDSQKGVGVVGWTDEHDYAWGLVGIASGVPTPRPGEYGGVRGYSSTGSGVYGYSIYGDGVRGGSSNGYAAYLVGRVYISGPLQKPGGSFKIDHPLDPANRYLYHSFVESSDMKNIYDGVVALDNKGEAEIELPDWFDALNKDFRYQLTAIGAPGPNLYIAEEIISDTAATKHSSHDDSAGNSNNNNRNRFKIAGGKSGMKVSWQVTGIRKDPWANAHRILVEEDKRDKERGYYLYPDLYDQPKERGINHLLFPENKENEEELLRPYKITAGLEEKRREESRKK